MIRTLKQLLLPNPFDALLRDAKDRGAKKILVVWNRGLGDIPLGLYALVYRIREYIPKAEIVFLTRPNLEEGFVLLGGVTTLVSATIRRGQNVSIAQELQKLGHNLEEFDLVIEKPDPTRWLYWQIGKLTPRLSWQSIWDKAHETFDLPCLKDRPVIGVHVQTETCYNYEKNWPETHWKQFFHEVSKIPNARVLLFGFEPTPIFEGSHIHDLRGRTNLLQMLSIIKNRCSHLVVPDSGVLSLAYYLDIETPLRVVSLWADPRQGVLRQSVPSPNPYFSHIAMVGKNKDTSRIPVDAVMQALWRTDSTCSLKTF